jgi:hypothetical protein
LLVKAKVDGICPDETKGGIIGSETARADPHGWQLRCRDGTLLPEHLAARDERQAAKKA